MNGWPAFEQSFVALVFGLVRSAWGMLTFNLPLQLVPHRLGSSPLVLSLLVALVLVEALSGNFSYVVLGTITACILVANWKLGLDDVKARQVRTGVIRATQPPDKIVSFVFLLTFSALSAKPLFWACSMFGGDEFAATVQSIWIYGMVGVNARRVYQHHLDLLKNYPNEPVAMPHEATAQPDGAADTAAAAASSHDDDASRSPAMGRASHGEGETIDRT